MSQHPTSILMTDTETTGLEARSQHIIQLAYIKFEHQPSNPLEIRFIEEVEMKLQLPQGVAVPSEVAKLNGYNAEVWAKEAIPRSEAIDRFLTSITWSSFGGQNPSFDYRFIDEELFRQKKSWPRMQNYALWSVDMLARPLQLLGYIPNVKQATLCEFFKIGEQEHDALEDIRQAVRIYQKLLWLTYKSLKDEHVQEAIDMSL